MATFAGVTFKALVAGHAYEVRDSNVTIESVPEGSTIVIDVGGEEEERIAFTCQFTSFADFLTMVGHAKVHTSDTLDYTEQTRAATLLTTSRQWVTPSGKTAARCEWVLTD